MLNGIVLNRTDYLHKNGFGIKYAIKPNKTCSWFSELKMNITCEETNFIDVDIRRFAFSLVLWLLC